MWADTPRESAIGSEIVFTCLPLPEDVYENMNLTTDLADELKVSLPLGRIIRDHYNEAMRRWDSQDGHIIVCKITEEDNHISMQIPGFVAPSKYGANPDYVPSGEMVTDQYGRIKPKQPDSYQADPFEPTPA